MGILSGITSNVAIIMKADTSQAKRATKELAKEQKKLAKETLKGLEDQNNALDESLKRWGKIAVGVGGAVAAFKAAQASFNAFAKDAQLRGATVGINLDKLRKATKGLVSDYDLLTQAAALNNTTFKLSQKEMEEVGKFMLILRKQGNDMAEVQKRVTQAFVEGKVEGLEPFGVVIENVGTKTEKAKNLMAEMHKQVTAFSGSLDIAGDDATKAGKAMDNAFRDAKVAIGEMVSSLGPLLVGLAKVTAAVAGLFKAGDPLGAARKFRLANDPGFAAIEERKAQTARLRASFARQRAADNAKAAAAKAAAKRKRATGGGRSAPGVPSFFGGILGNTFAGAQAGASAAQAEELRRLRQLALAQDAGRNAAATQPAAGGSLFGGSLQPSLAGLDSAISGLDKERKTQFLESTFGPVDQFDIYAGAFDGLTSAVTGAMQAWITGSKSMAAAFTEAISASLGGLAVQMQVEAIKEAAYGFSKLAWGEGAAAAAHFKSAAGFQAGAIAAAVGAKALGGSGAATSAGGIPTGTANVIGASGGGGGGEGRTVNVFVGDDFSRTDQRKRGAQFRRTMRDAMQGGSTTSGVAFG